MGDAADDVYEAAERQQRLIDDMAAAGCRRCHACAAHPITECPVCHDLGWLDRDGNPCEP